MVKTERFELRLDEEFLSRVDRWRAAAADVPSRAEALRRLAELGLERSSDDSVKFSDGEKLLLMMMRDLFKRLKVSDSDVDPDFIAEVIWGGHYWAVKRSLPGIFHGDEDEPQQLRYVQAVLEMWDRIERGYDRMSKKDKTSLAKVAGPIGEHVKFLGFDGNNEAPLLGIAQFLVNDMERWTRFAGRDLNSHMPTTPIYGRMLKVFEAMTRPLTGDLSVGQITALVQSMRHRD